MREPQVFHPIKPRVPTAYPDPEQPDSLETPDVARRAEKRRDFQKQLRRRIAKKITTDQLDPLAGRIGPPEGMKTPHSNKPPMSFPGRPEINDDDTAHAADESKNDEAIQLGDPLAARARKMKKKREKTEEG